ncbi:hypothetical protein kam1_1368 [Methylacidiphilum kamchatkense Kam1]|uniref:Uncharacterized protein n=1 Tax=Methylacidiphilum kamchatkense Kam1 TaxID=1202785 RepID=A0A516TMX9_9BACT|nr:hypothetical protein kam1_1368 [Methylacidiphilum kamchatkense Kam1]
MNKKLAKNRAIETSPNSFQQEPFYLIDLLIILKTKRNYNSPKLGGGHDLF